MGRHTFTADDIEIIERKIINMELNNVKAFEELNEKEAMNVDGGWFSWYYNPYVTWGYVIGNTFSGMGQNTLLARPWF